MADEWRDELRRLLRAMRDPDQRAERMRQYKQAQRAERAAQRKAAAERQPYTVADMTAAQAYLDTAQRRFDDYDGNNPNKHRADLQRARRTLDAITSDLRRRDIIPTPPPPEPTPKQKLNQTLDQTFPNANSRDEVEHDGKRYRRRFAKAQYGWDRWWEEVT